MAVRQLTGTEFQAVAGALRRELAASLERELACVLPKVGSMPSSDLWELPLVDSKTVAKLSPTVIRIIGRKLEPKWIRKGGYSSVEEAVKDLMAKIEHNCVTSTQPITTSQALSLSTTA